MVRRLVVVMVAVLIGVVVAAAGLGYAAELAGATTPSPAPVSASPAATTGTSPAPTTPPSGGVPGWLYIIFGVAIIVFAWTGGAARLQKRFQRPEPPDRP